MITLVSPTPKPRPVDNRPPNPGSSRPTDTRPPTRPKGLVDVYLVARSSRSGRWALALVWLGVLIATAGIAQLAWELRSLGPYLDNDKGHARGNGRGPFLPLLAPLPREERTQMIHCTPYETPADRPETEAAVLDVTAASVQDVDELRGVGDQLAQAVQVEVDPNTTAVEPDTALDPTELRDAVLDAVTEHGEAIHDYARAHTETDRTLALAEVSRRLAEVQRLTKALADLAKRGGESR